MVQEILQILIWIMAPLLVVLILLQGGAGDVSSAFGGGGQLDSALGVGANRKLAKITGWLSFLFLVFIVVLAMPRGVGFGDDTGTAGESAGTPAAVSTSGAGTDSGGGTITIDPSAIGEGAAPQPQQPPAVPETPNNTPTETEGSGVQLENAPAANEGTGVQLDLEPAAPEAQEPAAPEESPVQP